MPEAVTTIYLVHVGVEDFGSTSIVELTPSRNKSAEKIFEKNSTATGLVSSGMHKTAIALVAYKT